MAVTQVSAGETLIALLTIESLIFAVFSVAIGFGTSARTVVGSLTRKLACAGAAVLTVLAVGAGTAWVNAFVGSASTTHGFSGWCPAVAIAVGLSVQPVFAWMIALNI